MTTDRSRAGATSAMGAWDAHTHSSASDGTEPPAVVAERAAQAGLTAFALTDHDTTAGWAEVAAAARRVGVTVIRGIEISTARRGQSIHLLAYLPDPEHPGLAAELRRARESRDTRLDRMVALLAADGVPVTVESVRAEVADGATAGRPHIADALVRAGVVASRDEAFARYLAAGERYYVGHYAPDPVRAVELVRAAGGVPVLAHAWSGTRRRVVPDEVIEEMAAAGLAGLEVHHRDHDPDAVRHLAGLAAALGLLTTGSSDYHGDGKANRLGENTSSPETFDAIEAQATGSAVVRA
ncbi:MAG: PHP domain-containing protein [Dermatophilaceae bacterium]